MLLSTPKYLDTGPNKSQYKTFKIPLKSIIKSKDLLLKIEEIVFKLNELVIHSYQFIRLYILKCYTNNLPFEITEEFVRQCIGILSKCETTGTYKNKELLNNVTWFYINEYQPSVNHVKLDVTNMTAFKATIAVEIYTCLSNNVQERFISHFRRFVNETANGTNKEKNDFKYTILTKDLTVQADLLNINPIYHSWWNEHISKIFQTPPNKSAFYDIKVRPLYYLKGMLYMNTILEQNNKKLFQPLSLRTSIIPMNIMFDTTSITKYFTECQPFGILKSKIKMSENMEFAWSNILNLKDKIFKSNKYSFYHMMTTDGVSCSLTFIRKELIGKRIKSNIEELPFPKIEQMSDNDLIYMRNNCNIIGCDPGKRNLVYMVNDQKKHLTYTNPQRMHESKSKRNKIVLERWKKKEGISILEKKISECNSKSMNYLKFKEYLREKTLLNESTKEFYQHKTHRTMKLRSFIYEKKSIDNFINKIGKTFNDGRHIIIAYGDWSETTQMKNSAPSLGKGLRRLIHRKYFTFSVNEMYTSKRCNKCFNNLENFKDKKSKKVHRLLVCSTCVSSENKKVTYRSRDINAGINIMNVAKYYMMCKSHHVKFCHLPVI